MTASHKTIFVKLVTENVPLKDPEGKTTIFSDKNEVVLGEADGL